MQMLSIGKIFKEILFLLTFFALTFILGYGFVHFETEEAALNAIQKVNGMLLNGKKVFVGRFVPRKEREVELGEKARRFTNVYIKNINEEYDEGRLTEMFEKYGKISSVKVIVIRHYLHIFCALQFRALQT